MTMNPLPPQAYTKETLVSAYEWLGRQGKEIREMATTPDILVGLYMKAKIQGEDALERPSIQNFKNELKSLAGKMGEFDTQEESYTLPPVQAVKTQITPEKPAATKTVNTAIAQVANTPVSSPNQNMDATTQEYLKQLREQLNLSSEAEALRVAVAVGAKKLLGLLD